MGFGMCGATSPTQTPQQALDSLPPLRFFFQEGSGPNGGAGRAMCHTTSGAPSLTPARQWLTTNATNAGGASAVCLLTAAALFRQLGGKVPVGAVESCVSGTNVEPWTPPNGSLWKANMVPLLPMSFKAALWDQGEADAKRTSSDWYRQEFPNLITGWRTNLQTAELPFVYVELCSEYGAEEPKEADFWMAQRAAIALPAVGFAVTTDLQRALHPPDKQAVAERLLLSLRRVGYGEEVVSQGPELVSVANGTDNVKLTFSNASLTVHHGGAELPSHGCPDGNNTAMLQKGAAGAVPLLFSISGPALTVACDPALGSIWINSDAQQDCFLYSGTSLLPAPPIEVPCGRALVR